MRVRQLVPVLVAAGLVGTPALASAATAPVPYQVIHAFGTADSHNPNSSLVLAQDGADGDQPIGLIQAPSGTFYGVTQSGGGSPNCSSGCGTVFAMTAAGDVTVLHSFQGSTVDGWAPNPTLALAPDDRIYGTTKLGPIVTGTGEDWGIAFRLDPVAGRYEILHKFQAADGVHPQGGLIRATDGAFYGVTNEKGVNGGGALFRLGTRGSVTVIHAFAMSDGSAPKATLLQAANGKLYGTTQTGGSLNAGVIFSTSLSGVDFTVLHSFSNYARDGYRPITGLTQTPNGRLYGTTPLGGKAATDPNRSGVVYRLKPTGAVVVLHTFTGGSDGANPQAAVTWGGDGHLYGTTFVGGLLGKGVAFSIL